MPIIDVRRLSKWYGPIPAVRDATFHVEAGEVVGFLGPNGAGKSTTLRILTGFMGASSGEVTVAGHDVARDPARVQASLGYMPESCALYPEMRVVEYLSFRAELKRIARSKRKIAVESALRDAGLDDVVARPIANLSKGYRQRVGLADALLGEPPLLILDEPTAGLDPNQMREVRALVKRLRDKHTIFLSTHILSEVEAVCSRAVVIARGRVVADGTLDEIRALSRSSDLIVRAVKKDGRDDAEATRALLAKLPGVQTVDATAAAAAQGATGEPGTFVIRLGPDASSDDVAERVVEALVAANQSVREVRAGKTSLEDVFATLTQDQTRDADVDADSAELHQQGETTT